MNIAFCQTIRHIHSRAQSAAGIILVIWAKNKKQKEQAPSDKIDQNSAQTTDSTDVGNNVSKDEAHNEDDHQTDTHTDGQQSDHVQDDDCEDTAAHHVDGDDSKTPLIREF